MADDEDIRIESAAGELRSELSRSSVIMMEAAYLPGSRRHEEPGTRFFRTLPTCLDEEIPGPEGRVYITKLSARTPREVVRGIHGPASEDNRETSSNTDVYTVVFYINIRLNEPSTTRFLNATVSFITTPHSNILAFSPHRKETLAGIAGSAGDTIIVSPALEFRASAWKDESGPDSKRRFEVYVGPEEKICFTYGRESGFLFPLPGDELLEYVGRTNGYGVAFDMYPPMPPNDREMPGKGGHAIIPLILEVPRSTIPGFIIHIAGKVKGEIWGVVPLECRVHFLNPPADGDCRSG